MPAIGGGAVASCGVGADVSCSDGIDGGVTWLAPCCSAAGLGTGGVALFAGFSDAAVDGTGETSGVLKSGACADAVVGCGTGA